MSTGAITPYIDVAQVTLYAFWVFFAGLIYYLLRENKREGYPLESDRSGSIDVQGWPAVPEPKTYRLQHGGTVSAPSGKRSAQPLAAEPTGSWGGAPLVPTGNPMLDGVGPGAWADRADVPDMDFEGHVKIVPLRLAAGGAIRDGISSLATQGRLGEALASNVTGYSFVYHLEIYLLFAALVAIGPLVRTTTRRAPKASPQFGLAEFPG